jgi:hypothetical protein
VAVCFVSILFPASYLLDFYLGNSSNSRAVAPACFTKKVSGQMYQIHSALVKTLQSVFECQLECQKYNLCNSFSYGKLDKTCRPVVAANATLTSASNHDVYELKWI